MNSPTQLKLAAFQVVCLLANELIEALMGKEIDHLESIYTAKLMPYDNLHFAFDESGEFDDEVFALSDTEMDEEMQVILKRQKQPFSLFHFTDDTLKMIQQFSYTKGFEMVNRRSLTFRVHKHYWQLTSLLLRIRVVVGLLSKTSNLL